MKLTLGLAQISTKLGDTQANLDKHLSLVKQADQAGVDLLIFPELSLTGYVLQTWFRLCPLIPNLLTPSSTTCWRRDTRATRIAKHPGNWLSG